MKRVKIKNCRKTIKVICLLILLVSWPLISADIVMVVNVKNKISSIDKNTIKQIYLGKKQIWTFSKLKIRPVILRQGTKSFDQWYSSVLEIKFASFNKYWMRKLFSGSSIAPKRKSTVRSMLEYVSLYEEAIGYCYANEITQEIKGIKIIKIK